MILNEDPSLYNCQLAGAVDNNSNTPSPSVVGSVSPPPVVLSAAKPPQFLGLDVDALEREYERLCTLPHFAEPPAISRLAKHFGIHLSAAWAGYGRYCAKRQGGDRT